jgi:hypothetical protein
MVSMNMKQKACGDADDRESIDRRFLNQVFQLRLNKLSILADKYTADVHATAGGVPLTRRSPIT